MFVSGTTYQLLQLGQTIGNDGASLPPQPQEAAPQPSAGLKRKLSVSVKPTNSGTSTDRASPGSAKTGGSKGGPSLLDLIEAGMLQPGNGNMSVTYKGNTYTGTLQANGTIFFRGSVFNTPSAFSVHVKRLVTPNKQGDDGWHSVYVDGVLLNAVRQQYHAKVTGQPPPAKQQRKQQTSPRQQQQQTQPKQQQPPAAEQQQQPLGVRPPLPMPKLKLGAIKGLPQPHQQQQQQASKQKLQQQQQPGQHVLQPQPLQQAASKPQQQQQQPHKLKFKQPLKLHLGKATPAAGTAAAAAATAGAQPTAAAAPTAAVGAGGAANGQHPGGPGSSHPILVPHAGSAGDQQQAPGESHWVRCSRCEVWRCVPEQFWPQVQALGASWACEDACWSVEQQQPFTAACQSDVWAEASDDGMMVPAM